MPETGENESTKRSTKRKRVALGLAAGVLALFIGTVIFAGSEKHRRIILTFKGVSTNGSGMAEVEFELRNEAADLRLEPKVLVVTEEEKGRVERDEQGRMRKAFPGWTTTYVEKGMEKYLTGKAFSELPEPVRSSAGMELRKGESTVLRFRKPDQSWHVMADCTGPGKSAQSSLRAKVEQVNAWANAKLGLPLIFTDQSFYSLEVSSGIFPAGQEAQMVGRRMEYRVD